MNLSLQRLLAACLFACACGAIAQESFPARPVRLVVPFPAGGLADVLARTIAGPLGEALGQPIVVENRPGAGTAIAAEHTARAAPDGYTVMFGSVTSHAILPIFNPKVPYHPIKDFTAIAPVAAIPFVVVVHPSVRADSIKALVDLAKSSPGKLTAGSSGNGTSNHLALELFKTVTGTDIVHVPYKGTAPALNDLLAGQISMLWDGVPTSAQHIQAGKLRGLAVTSRDRVPALGNLPTMIEAGVPDYDVSPWFGLFGPTGVSDPIVVRLNRDLARVVAAAAVKEKLAAQGAVPMSAAPEQFAAFVRNENERWARVVQASGMKAE